MKFHDAFFIVLFYNFPICILPKDFFTFIGIIKGMEKQQQILSKITTAIIYLLAIALSIKSFREPDLWWQIRTGEWILENGKVPMVDIFSYTRDGVRWINIKWLSEILAAITTKLLGPESVVLLQSIVSAAMVFFLLKWSRLFFKSSQGKTLVSLLLLIPLLAGSEYRMTGRPEMYSHLFAIIFCYIYTRHSYKQDKWIWLVIPLQLLWANLHEAFAIGIVISGIYVFAAFIDSFIKKVPQRDSIRILLIAFISVVAIAINPNGLDLILRPLAILGQLEANKYTTELVSIGSGMYWKKEAWIAISFLILIIGYAIFWIWKSKAKSLKAQINSRIIAYTLLLIAFSYLAASAFRNIILLLLILYPAVVVIAGEMFESVLSSRPKLMQRSWISLILFGAISYGLVVSNEWYELSGSRDTFGMEVSGVNNPTGAAHYLKRNPVSGYIFSDYLTSSYLLWKLQPNFKTFIDLRDLDVFSDTSFTDFSAMVQIPEVFEEQDSIYHFSTVVLFRPQFPRLHNYLYNSNEWRVIFADAVAVVYLRDTTKSNFSFSSCSDAPSSSFSKIVNRVLNPFYQQHGCETLDNNRIAASYFLNAGDYERALTEANISVTAEKKTDEAYQILGDVYYKKALVSSSTDERVSLLQFAFQAYQSSLSGNSNNALARLGLGAVHFQNGNFKAAVEQFNLGIKSNPDLLNLYLFAAEAYSMLMEQDPNANSMILKYNKCANNLNPDNPSILLNIATAAYRAGDCEEAVNFASKVKEVTDFNEAEKNALKTILTNCGNK